MRLAQGWWVAWMSSLPPHPLLCPLTHWLPHEAGGAALHALRTNPLLSLPRLGFSLCCLSCACGSPPRALHTAGTSSGSCHFRTWCDPTAVSAVVHYRMAVACVPWVWNTRPAPHPCPLFPFSSPSPGRWCQAAAHPRSCLPQCPPPFLETPPAAPPAPVWRGFAGEGVTSHAPTPSPPTHLALLQQHTAVKRGGARGPSQNLFLTHLPELIQKPNT